MRSVSHECLRCYAKTTFGREALQTASLTYLAAHFHEGTVSVFAPADPRQEYVLQVVANKYNPTNYWCGHIRCGRGLSRC